MDKEQEKDEIVKEFLNNKRSSLEWEQVNEELKKEEEEEGG